MKRKILAILLTLCMLVGLSPVYALEAPVSGTYGTNITWTLDTDGTLTISGHGEMRGDSYSTPWGDYREDIKSVVISDGVTSIVYCAFIDCTNLTDITIPDGVTSIGDRAFEGCTNLTDITIPDSVTSISDSVFSHCNSLTSITIPNGVTSIDNYAFSWCHNLMSITIPDSVTSIGTGAFLYCDVLKTITVDSSNPAFCVENGVLFSKDKTVLCSYPAGMTTSSYAIPETVTTIADAAFGGCWRLQNITIPDSVTSISDIAFSGCSSLASITIPASVTSIGRAAFHGCRKLSVLVDDANEHFCIVDGVIFSKDMTTLVWYLQGKTGASYVVPDGVTTIADSAFYNDNDIKSITLPDGVTNVGDETFAACQNLESVTLPATVRRIGFAAFLSLPNLTEVHFGGTKAQWSAVSIEPVNEELQSATIYCSDGVWDGFGTVQPEPPIDPETPVATWTFYNHTGAVGAVKCFADGTVEVDATVPEGVTAEIIIRPDEGADLSNMGAVAIIVNEDGSEEIIQKSIPSEYGFTFFLDRSAKVKIRNNAVTFSDVAEKNWFKKAVDFVSARGIMGGVGNNTFDHKSTTTRAMVFTMLARLNGVDTAGGATWYEKGANWVVENGLSDGLNATDVIPREELAVLLWKLNGSPDADTAILDGFSDSEGISASAREAVAWAVMNGVMGGNADGTMDPTGGATRAHVAQIIMNYMTKI